MNCPTDGTTLLMSERNGIEIDYCPDCRGIWLDRGELDKILDAVKGDAPAVHPRRDYAWAAGGALGVVLASVALTSFTADNSTATPVPQVTATASSGASTIETDATSPLGDLRPFVVIVNDLDAKLKAGDFASVTARAKDLEVAWDSKEAAIKPASPGDWHQLDGAIDELLTSVRATTPSVDAINSAITGFRDTVAAIDRKQ